MRADWEVEFGTRNSFLIDTGRAVREIQGARGKGLLDGRSGFRGWKN